MTTNIVIRTVDGTAYTYNLPSKRYSFSSFGRYVTVKTKDGLRAKYKKKYVTSWEIV